MKAVADDRGVIAAAAMDQRGSLQKALAKERGGAVGDKDLEEFKTLVTEVLTRHASAILLDPEWGLPASKRRARGSGLLLAYEKTGYDATTPGRLPDLLDLWSVRRLKEAGGDCIKILLYYSPNDAPKINDLKHAWVERIGDECRANDIPFFLEVIAYEDGLDEKTVDFARKKPELVTAYMREFTKDRYGVDVLKVEVPIAEFSETLELAAEAGTRYSGVLCGRATWKDGIAIYAKQGADAFRTWLESEGVKNIANVNERLKPAHPWFAFYGAKSADELAAR
jgi:tagatose 1,6-diphosphate aldolase